MFFRKKKQQPENAITITSRETLRRIVREWDIKQGRHRYSLKYAIRHKFSNGEVRYSDPRAIGFYPLKDALWQTEASGDVVWARRTAKHFGLKIEDEDVA